MDRKAYLAAANRAKYVVEHYPKTASIPNALAIMVTAYELLNLNELADDARKILKLNYPEFAKSRFE